MSAYAEQIGNDTYIRGIAPFDLEQTLNCGQCFRFKRSGDSWSGVARDRVLSLRQIDRDTLVIENCVIEDAKAVWWDYFDLDRDYADIIARVSEDSTLKAAAEFSGGIRILRQQPWEMLITFIISQNNNIPRITGIIERLCENFGDKISDGCYTFPDARRIAELSDDELAVLRCGFRLRYIRDAAAKVNSGAVDLDSIYGMDLDAGRDALKQICGVGDKVAACVLLFGYGKVDAFPVDVWIGRVMEKLFPNGLPKCALEYRGIVQQHLFHYARVNSESLGIK